MNPAHPSPTTEPVWLRLLRSLVAIGLAFALTVISALLVIGYLTVARETFEQLFSFNGGIPKVAVILTSLFVILLPLGLLGFASRRRWLTLPALAIGWLAVLPVFAWLVWDEPAVRQPLTVEEFSPAFPGADASYAVLMQYSKQSPSPEAKAFAAFKSAVLGFGNTREPAKWKEFVIKNRAALETDWAALVPQRRWLADLAAFDRLGDLTPTDVNANIITFNVWRTLSQRACAIATLQALDGRGDDAVATLLPILEAGRKLQPSSRTLVRSMIGVVAERMALETAAIVLDQTPVSAASRAHLAATLGNENAPALARRLILVDYVQFGPVFSTMKLGDFVSQEGTRLPLLRRPLNLLTAVFFNPNATLNIYGDRVRELADLAEARDLGRFAVRSQDFGSALVHRPGMKNVGGRLLLNMSVPAYSKVLESHWKTADLRIALRQRLAGAQ